MNNEEQEIVARIQEYVPDVPSLLFSCAGMSKPRLERNSQSLKNSWLRRSHSKWGNSIWVNWKRERILWSRLSTKNKIRCGDKLREWSWRWNKVKCGLWLREKRLSWWKQLFHKYVLMSRWCRKSKENCLTKLSREFSIKWKQKCVRNLKFAGKTSWTNVSRAILSGRKNDTIIGKLNRPANFKF